uniref:hypothetical protein n=1 Tax=Wohlfahrtiimonas populi TaxID=1940240 RepID=UPI00130146D5
EKTETLGEPILEENEYSLDPMEWGVTKVANDYIFSCISSQHGGKELVTKISTEDFHDLMNEKVTYLEITYKYKL